MTLPQDFIGVDIAKDWIDIFRLSSGRRERIATTAPALARFARTARGTPVILKASGGYERPLAQALARAGVDYARVNPRQAREFARATGRLAKTDRVDAELLARMGRALEPAPTPPLDANHARLPELGRLSRAELRRALYLDAFIASRYDPPLKAFRQRLQDAGKPVKLAITACARKLLTILNATFRDQTSYRNAPARKRQLLLLNKLG